MGLWWVPHRCPLHPSTIPAAQCSSSIESQDRTASGLLGSALSVAFKRGDALVNVIVAENDSEPSHLAAERGLERTVDVFPW